MKYHVKTFGCQMNYADSEKLHTILMRSGGRHTTDPLEADVVILNTCSVRKKWEDKVYGYIDTVASYHRARGTRPCIGMTGCMVRKTGLHRRHCPEDIHRVAARRIELLADHGSIFNADDKILAKSRDVDFTMRIEEVALLPKILSALMDQDIGSDVAWHEYLRVEQTRSNPSTASVIVQTGCDNYCTYCIVPYTRGRELSRPEDDILAEVERVAREGAKEIVLLGQNVNSYGKLSRGPLWDAESLTWKSSDHLKTPLRELLEKIDRIPGVDRIRFTSSNPHDMTRDILDAHFELPHICRSLLFALQSGDDEVLHRMNRKHTYADFRAQVEYLRSRDPFFSIFTDIIVGFPWETVEAFEKTVRAFEECEFDFAYIARYSPRPGTRAGDYLEDDVPPLEKARRWDILNTILHANVERRGKSMIGRIEPVLLSTIGRDTATIGGRTRNFKEVYLPRTESTKIGDIVPVEITGQDEWVLRGKLAM